MPNICALYTLGWMRRKRLVEVKKLLFIWSVLMLENNVGVRKAFIKRVMLFFNDPDSCSVNTYTSPTYDLMSTACDSGMNCFVRNAIESRASELESSFCDTVALAALSLRSIRPLG